MQARPASPDGAKTLASFASRAEKGKAGRSNKRLKAPIHTTDANMLPAPTHRQRAGRRCGP
jgi:hypothetical protein